MSLYAQNSKRLFPGYPLDPRAERVQIRVPALEPNPRELAQAAQSSRP